MRQRLRQLPERMRQRQKKQLQRLQRLQQKQREARFRQVSRPYRQRSPFPQQLPQLQRQRRKQSRQRGHLRIQRHRLLRHLLLQIKEIIRIRQPLRNGQKQLRQRRRQAETALPVRDVSVTVTAVVPTVTDPAARAAREPREARDHRAEGSATETVRTAAPENLSETGTEDRDRVRDACLLPDVREDRADSEPAETKPAQAIVLDPIQAGVRVCTVIIAAAAQRWMCR